MMWLEMSRDEAHGGEGWGFKQCLWAPTKKKNGANWTYWKSLLNVTEGDLVLHLRGKLHPVFVGFSEAAGDGYQTLERPPVPGQWEFAGAYYRVPLRNFTEFTSKLFLKDVFSTKDNELRAYFDKNKARKKGKAHLFYVLQAGRLQCLNGAYLSEVDPELLDILLEEDIQIEAENVVARQLVVATSQQIRQMKARVGQQAFAANVKRNYGYRCAFPECEVNDPAFLIGSHIARWSDVAELRGDVSNGICFCLMHDKAFEQGYFTVDTNLRISINFQRAKQDRWFQESLSSHNGKSLRIPGINPSIQALKHHWERIDYTPEEKN